MSDWRKVCEAIVTFGSKATARPWIHTNRGCSIHSDSSLVAHNFEAEPPSDDPEWWDVGDRMQEQQGRDFDYIVASANNADRLARFAMRLVALIDEGWVGPEDAERWASEIWDATSGLLGR